MCVQVYPEYYCGKLQGEGIEVYGQLTGDNKSRMCLSEYLYELNNAGLLSRTSIASTESEDDLWHAFNMDAGNTMQQLTANLIMLSVAIRAFLQAGGGICHRAYIVGYKGILLPRWVRKLICGSSVHRSWLAGIMGVYTDTSDSKFFGVCDRAWYLSR